MIFSCDTETIKDPDGSMRVWLVDACTVGESLVHSTFTNLSEFFEYIFSVSDESTCYFHNLRFDGSYILCWAFDHGYQWSENKKLQPLQFSFLITDASQWFCGTMVNAEGRKIKFIDSLKKIPLSVKAMAKAYNLPIEKGEIDYMMYRPIGYQPTEDEIHYIRHDTEIVARVLKIHLDQGMDKLTAPADALAEYQKTIDFNATFHPRWYQTHPLEEKFCRRAYCGGISWVNPEIKNKIVRHGFVYDYNSMYPSVMLAYSYPTGYPVRWYDKVPPGYDLYIAHALVKIERKAGCPACIRDPIRNTWIETSYEGELWLTSVDVELLLQNYYESDNGYIILQDGYAWKGETGVFEKYIAHWREVKENTTGGQRQIAKLMLNSLYGKFGTKPLRRHKIPKPDDENNISYTLSGYDSGRTYCVAVAAFVTAYARRELVRGIHNTVGFCYCDTDSIHAAAIDGVCPKFTGAIDDKKFLHWKRETNCFTRAKYLRQKTYIEELPDGKLNIAACGCPMSSKNYITFDNFKIGASYKGKLMPKMRRGGVELVTTRFTIKDKITMSRF